MSSGSQTLMTAIAAALGHQAVLIAVLAAVTIVVVCTTVVILVFMAAEDDRPKVVTRLAPVLERLADGFALRRHRRAGRRRGHR